MAGYHTIAIPMMFRHLFFVRDWYLYISAITDWSKRKDRPIRKIDQTPYPQNPGK